VLGRHYSVVFSREVTPLLDEMQEQLRGGTQREVTQNLTLTNQRKPVHAEVTVLRLEGVSQAPEGVVIMLKDVTAIQRTQRALAWREVARRIAHEIKNPLTPIQVQAERLRRRYVNGNSNGNDEGQQLIDQSTRTIINEVSSLKKMVNEFSQFAKLPESQPVPDNLNEVLRELAPLYENGLPENIHMELDLDPDLPIFPLDREQIRRVFTNLVDNAAAAVGERGTIRVVTRYDRANGLATAEVLDDGPGVPEDLRSQLFEPYTTTKEGGTGLGLTIANQIVSDHSGYIRYHERKPNGSAFVIEFPLR
jgi:two-component system nitrogen regulation sensor histidine kinase NtrY